MENNFSTYVIVNNVMKCVYKTHETAYEIFDRKSTTATSFVEKSDISQIVNIASDEFIQLTKDFRNYLSAKLFRVANKRSIDKVPHDIAIMQVITQCFEDNNGIMDEEDWDESFVEDCVQATMQFIGSLITPQKYVQVKLYIVEQLLQKHYCHIFNEEWISDKQNNYQLDLHEGPRIAVFC